MLFSHQICTSRKLLPLNCNSCIHVLFLLWRSLKCRFVLHWCFVKQFGKQPSFLQKFILLIYLNEELVCKDQFYCFSTCFQLDLFFLPRCRNRHCLHYHSLTLRHSLSLVHNQAIAVKRYLKVSCLAQQRPHYHSTSP